MKDETTSAVRAAHTPGPWSVSELDAAGDVSEFHIFIEPGIAVIERKTVGQDGNDMPDARLIAAAPELLEALRLAVNAMRAPLDGWKGDVEAVALAEANAAIAKATGSTS